MRTVQSLMEALAKFPPDAHCYAYEGEVTGVVIVKLGQTLGVVWATEGEGEDTMTEDYR